MSSLIVTTVILHYITIEDTIQCLNSVKKCLPNTNIVIVDNGSNNSTGEELRRLFLNDEYVKIIILDQNLGFSKGNNVGYKYARENLNSDIVLVLNNDTYITQEDFEEKLISINKKGYDIVGPLIESSFDGQMQNPTHYNFSSKRKVLKRIIKYYILRFLLIFNLDDKFNKNRTENSLTSSEYQLHGSALIFMNNFLRNENDAFDSNIFMYCEEDILKQKAISNNYIMKFDDSIKIFHKEKSSTNKIFGKSSDRKNFYYSNSIASLKYLYSLMRKNKYEN